VVATHGTNDHEALKLALGSEAVYVALVGSRRRAESILPFLRDTDLSADQLARLKVPAGLDLGAVEPAEIALSIMAEIVETRRRAGQQAGRPGDWEMGSPGASDDADATAIDPVCGMTVEVASARHTAEYDGRVFCFCCPGCRYSFLQAPAKYLVAA
jgi:xanthine dehydrogenase accessory factor